MAFRLSKSVIHTFPAAKDFDKNPYVFDVCNNTQGLLAVSACGPGHVIKVYDEQTLSCSIQLGGHAAAVNDIHFSLLSPHLLYSSSSDGTVKVWDMRSPHAPVSSISSGGKPFWSAHLNSDETMMSTGCGRLVRVYDMRTQKLFRNYSDVHTEDVTQVRCHPTLPSITVSGGEDGLICVSNHQPEDEDDSLEAVFNVEVAISRIGFCGNLAQQVYCTTNIHSLQMWDVGKEKLLVNVEDMRGALQSTSPHPVDYLVDCKYQRSTDTLHLFTGSESGHLSMWRLSSDGPQLEACMQDKEGHVAIVRGVCCDFEKSIIWSGGEDCKVCMWKHDANSSLPPISTDRAGGVGKVRNERKMGWSPY
mmetsp:Transcript_44250/g.139600  ORF Transcript_44250/g.139600 Transcript_44250/m.139600 type:complete len:361 (-) Transcript_44250:438-1520(-)